MASNINPSLTPVNSLTNFKFWCQKVLPLVYDDSLSYYEVLGKMVVQLNDVIDNVNADTENVLTLKDAFLELQTYVNNFFDDIDQLASYAERAEAAQTAANTSAVNAATSASNASASSLAAMDARDTAVTAKQAAETSANTASTAAANANTKANEAAQSAITAQTAQASASQSATLAATDRSAAQTAASTATTKANEANTSATNAETSAENAAQSEANAKGLVNNIQENLDNIQQNTQDISGLKESLNDVLISNRFILTGSTSNIYDYTFTVGKTYFVTNRKSGTSPQIRTCTQDGTLVEWIKNGLAFGETVKFTPTLSASYFRIYYSSSNCEIEIAENGLVLDSVNDDLDTEVFDVNLNVGTDNTGYYTGNVGEQITYTEQATSHSFTVDLSTYINRTVRVKLANGSTTSARITALCNSSGVINQKYTESEVMKGVSIYPNSANSTLYISYSTSGSGLSCYVLSPINESFQNVQNISGKIAYVDSSVAADGDGSPNNPFKEIASAIYAGYGVIYAKAGSYQPVEAFGLGAVSIRLWNREVDSNGKLKKIVITAVDRKSGIWCDNCNDVTIEDVEFNAPSRYGLYITNCKSVNVTRCIAYNNTTESFSLFRVDNSNGVFRDCVAYGATLDGFNIHTAGDTQFINCKAYNCGDDGISHHENCTGAIIGGEFYGNGKGGVSPFSGSEVNIYDVYSHDNTRYGIYCATSGSYGRTKTILANCALKGNGEADIYVNNSDITGFNNIYDTTSLVSTGTYTEITKSN